MIDKKILISIVIVLLIGVAAASYQITTKTPGVWQPSVLQAQTANEQGSSADSSSSSSGQAQTGSQSLSTSTTSGQSGSGGDTVKVTASEAQTIAQNHNLQEGTITGTPKLIELDGNQFYYVPIFDKNENKVGEIYVNAQTGKTSLE